MKGLKAFLSLILSGVMLVLMFFCKGMNKPDVTDLFDSERKISYSATYSQLSATKKNKEKLWREGMVSGNGLQGVITSGAPYDDTFIFQNMHFILPNQNVRYCPDTFDELEQVKQNIVKLKDIKDDASYDDVYRFHPGGELRISMKRNLFKNYVRYTDYSSGQVGVRFSDKSGTWERTTFTSRADGATITKIASSSTGSKVNLVLSYDDISVLANFGKSDEVNLKYKKLVSDDCSSISLVAHYPDYKNSELKEGGYASSTYVVSVGGKKEKINGSKVQDDQYVSNENPQIKITDADFVYLITISDRTYNMGKYTDFDAQETFPLVDSLVSQTGEIAQKYSKDGDFDYNTALSNHLDIYKPLFEAVTLSLGDGESQQSNEKLIKTQRKSKKLISAFAQRAYYSGRYAYLCCSGYSTSRLYGMWTGEWNAGWGSKYTMDANVNLQTSSMNTGNITTAPIGYANCLLRQLPDWEENAKATHGFTNAIQAPVHSDGDSAVITETCYPYPFRYWNAGASWLIQPLYETLQCYGDIKIPLCDEFNLNELRSVLSVTDKNLTDEQIQAFEKKGYLSLKYDILPPMLIKSANYWRQLMTAEYYTDKNGVMHYKAGKKTLNDDEYYCILPSYSPENNPKNYPSPSDANAAIDISACRDNLKMLIDLMSEIDPEYDLSQWQYLMDKLPPYLYDDTGALKEWACSQYKENNEHRHLSHLYCVWPLFETQKDEKLKQACIQAINNRESENEASHALIHRSLIAARLKQRQELTQSLGTLMTHKIHYNSLMTNHNFDRSSCYCTDFAIGYLGIINESLLYSNSGEIEILPALPTSGFDSGKVTGLRARTRAEITELTWDTNAQKASVTIKSDIDQTITVSCGLFGKTQEINLKKGESQTISFAA